MVSNEHNPIAERIGRIQNIWKEKIDRKSGYKIVRLIIRETDLPIINGFLKLESSPYGKIEETPVVMLTDFADPQTFAWQLCNDWLEEYARALEQYPQLPWKEHAQYLTKIKEADHIQQETLLLSVLESFSQSLPNYGQNMLLLGLVPRLLCGYELFEKWLGEFCKILPSHIALLVIDYTDKEVYSTLASSLKEHCVTIRLDSLDMEGAYNDLLTQGNPKDPNVKIRTVMVEMGKAASKDQRGKLDDLGERLLDIGRESGQASLWLYTYIVYAGFLFRYKDGQALALLDKGITLCDSHQSDSSVAAMTVTAYTYKASYLNYIGKHEEALKWFERTLDYCLLHNDIINAIGVCRKIITLSILNSTKEAAAILLRKILPHLSALDEESHKYTETFLVVAFIIFYDKNLTKNERKDLDGKMNKIHGEDWLSRATIKFQQIKNPKQLSIDEFS